MSTKGDKRVVNVGIIGCGEITQVVHIPTLLFMASYFRITYLCDISVSSLKHCQGKIPDPGARVTRDAGELCASENVDAVMVLSSDEYHITHALSALQHHKHVLVEKPLALNKSDALLLIEAERKSRGRVMVGYMRRYAAPMEEAIKEIGGLDKILYGRVRDIIGPGVCFVGQSGAFPKRFTDFSEEDAADKSSRAEQMVRKALQDELGDIPVTPETTRMWRNLQGLGSHDLSLMREVLGMPAAIAGSSLGFPFWNVLFKYPSFTVSYESGRDQVPRFDAHLEVYGEKKTVRLQYDTSYVKGLPVTLHVAEDVNGAFKESVIRHSYEDPYTQEMRAFWAFVAEGKEIKTTEEDALQDLELLGMVMKHGYGESVGVQD